MREFNTGATRDGEDGKLDYEGFLSPSVIKAYASYMHKHRKQADGNMRDSDNWQNGIPMSVYAKSAWRHFMDFWSLHRGQTWGMGGLTQEEAICACLFNLMGYLHEWKKHQHQLRYEKLVDTYQEVPEPSKIEKEGMMKLAYGD